MFGSGSVETWANTGAADFAYAKNTSFNITIGCASKYTIKSTEETMFFLGHDGIVYRLSDSAPVRISHEGVEADIANSDMGSARAFTYTEDGHRFYSLSLLKAGGDVAKEEDWSNWTYDLMTGFWTQRSQVRVLCSVDFGLRGDTLIGMDWMGESTRRKHKDYGIYALSIRPFKK